jgi:hypothetical protein
MSVLRHNNFVRIDYWRRTSQNSRPTIWGASGSARQLSSLELMFPNLLCKLDAADRDHGRVEPFESEHRPYPLFDSAMILLHDIIQVLAGSYANSPGHYSR